MNVVSRRQHAWAAAVWALVIALTPGAVLTIMAWGDMVTSDAISNLCAFPAAVLYATLGALVIRRAGNIIGWFLLGEGLATAIMGLASAYAVLGSSGSGTLPAAKIVGLLAEWCFVPVASGIAFMFLLFPTGHLPSPRWRPVAGAGLVVIALTIAGFLLRPRRVALPAPGGISVSYQNPLAARSLPGPLSVALIGTVSGLSVIFIALLAASIVAMTLRYRSGGRELRQQIKWVGLTIAAAIACSVVALASIAISGRPSTLLSTVAYTALTVIGLAGFPVAIAVAILKHGLYQIDVILTRAVSYGLLSAVLTAVYAGIVIGIGTLAGYAGGPVLTVAAAVAVALLFQPVRQRAGLLANRLVYGERTSPYQVLADFARDMAGQLDADAALDRMAAVLAGATGAVRVEVWVLVGTGLRPRSVWPAGAEPATVPVLTDGQTGLTRPGPVSRAIGVYHRDELLGAITLVKWRNEPVSAAEDKLLTDLASQAGLVLRNVGLTAQLQATIEDLRASRRRLVRAQDDERQRIERNLHDGAQQQLVALSVQLSVLEDAADDPREVRELAGQIRAGLRAALDDLRSLARGIYPPVLADQGLRAALQAQADRVPMPVLIDADGLGRFSRETEAALYFCILEALQNVAKYARASLAAVTLTRSDGRLAFSVADDGSGFDPAKPGPGTGLQGMADRLAAVGGVLQVRSQPGHGTTVSGTLPLRLPA